MIKRLLNSKKGAASIMVMLLLVVLVVFGIAALTTALSSLRLGQKVDGWNSDYYAAEGVANERFAMIDKAVMQAFSQGGDVTAAAEKGISSLGFAETSLDGTALTISYETWSGDIGISSVLILDIADMHSLHVTQWKEIQ